MSQSQSVEETGIEKHTRGRSKSSKSTKQTGGLKMLNISTENRAIGSMEMEEEISRLKDRSYFQFPLSLRNV